MLLETTPAMIVGTEPAADTQSPNWQRQATFLPQTYFKATLTSLWTNYFQLFKHFGLLNFWLSLFDQIMVLAPYVLAAPLIFDEDPARRITLGTLMKMSNSFDKVFGSLSVIAENWGAVNDFRSTYRRLREFEDKLYANTRVGRGLLPAEVVQMTALERRDPPNGATTRPSSDQPPRIPVVNGVDPAIETTYHERDRLRERESGRESGRKSGRERERHFVPIHVSGPHTETEMRV